MTLTFDALIIGGGPGGATSALLLAKAGWSVALVEKASFPRGKVCGEFLSATNLPLLRHLGVAESFLELAGPDVRQVGLFSGDHAVTADMPRPRTGTGLAAGRVRRWGGITWIRCCCSGRRLPGTRLAALVRGRAGQPRERIPLPDRQQGGGQSRSCARESWCRSRLVGTRPLAHAAGTPVSRPSDLFGFKAHFLTAGCQRADAAPVFSGGYGGMVHSDHGRVSLSCCIRRDQLKIARRAAGQ